MTWWDKVFAVASFLAIILIQCKWQAKLFAAQRSINHTVHAIIYCAGMVPVLIFFWPCWWQVIAIGVLERLALFDPILNRIRGKPYYYNGTPGSWMDRIENKLSAWWVFILKHLYIIIFILAVIFIK